METRPTSSWQYLLHHKPMLAALGRGLLPTWRARAASAPPELPSDTVRAHVAAPPGSLIDDFVRFCGGDPAAYQGTVPPHLYSQWALPVALRVLQQLPFPLTRILNGGASLEIHRPLLRRAPLQVAGRLVQIEDTGRRIRVEVELTTSQAGMPTALTARLHAVIPKKPTAGRADPPSAARRGPSSDTPPNTSSEASSAMSSIASSITSPGTASSITSTPTSAAVASPTASATASEIQAAPPRIVPYHAQALMTQTFHADAGRRFALLTGDLNPIHWLRPYAKAFGFKKPILQGFATLGYVVEAFNRTLLEGDPARLRQLTIRFTRPVVLPDTLTVFHFGDDQLFVGRAPGGPAVAVGEARWHAVDEVVSQAAVSSMAS